jgi:hypothetical protein
LQLTQRWQERQASVAGNAALGEAGRAAESLVAQGLLWELLPSHDEEIPAIISTEEPPGSCRGSPIGVAAGVEEPSAVAAGEFAGEDGQAEEVVAKATWISGGTFERVPRHSDCDLSAFEDHGAFHIAPEPAASASAPGGAGGVRDSAAGPPAFRCWNAALETQVVGASRQLVASTVPMAPLQGRYRMDLRVVSGIEAEAAHLFEVGLAVAPQQGVCFRADAPGSWRKPRYGHEQAGQPFIRLMTAQDELVEGVRLVVEADFDEAVLRAHCLPTLAPASARPSSDGSFEGGSLMTPADAPPDLAGIVAPTQGGEETGRAQWPIGDWLEQRAKTVAMRSRPPGELDCDLFRTHAAHLQDLVDLGKMDEDEDLATQIRSDVGLQCALNGEWIAPAIEDIEDCHFYVVVPAGMELEIF